MRSALPPRWTNPAKRNHVRAHTQADLAVHGDERRATTRIFGSRPGTYGAGLLQLIGSRDLRTDADLAEVYTVWGGYASGRELDGRSSRVRARPASVVFAMDTGASRDTTVNPAVRVTVIDDDTDEVVAVDLLTGRPARPLVT